MPDTDTESNNKKIPSETKSNTNNFILKHLPVRWQFLAIGAVAIVAIVWGSIEVHDRIVFVHEVDARIQTSLITVSSRVSGWASNVSASLGDDIVKGGVLAKIDARESKLELTKLVSELNGIQAEQRRGFCRSSEGIFPGSGLQGQGRSD